MAGPVVRFAPSPTGRIHIGNARSAAAQLPARPRRRGGTLHAALRRHRPRALARGICRRPSARTSPGSASCPTSSCASPTASRSTTPRSRRLKAAGRLYPCYETEDELDRRRKRQAARGPAAGLRPRRADADRRRSAPRWRREGRRPHWRFLLEHRVGGLGRPRARRRATSTAPRCPTPCWCARTAPISTRCPPWSTTSTSASPTSSAARTTSPTPACRSRSSRRWARLPRPPSGTTTC